MSTGTERIEYGNVRNDGPDLLTPVENDHEAFVLRGQQESGSAGTASRSDWAAPMRCAGLSL